MKLFLFNNEEKLLGTTSPISATQKEELNSIQTLEAVVRYSELVENAVYIGHKDYIKSDVFHLYKIDTVTKHDVSDVKITAVNSFFDDMESDGYIKDYRPENRDILSVLTTILTGSRWQVGTCNAQRNLTSNFYYVTRKAALSKVIEATQIEIRPRYVFNRGKITNRYLDVFTRLGRDNGKVFVHGKDLLTVSEKKSKGAIYTAVVGRGKGEEKDTGGYGRRISFKDVVWSRQADKPVDKPAGQEYVEIPAMTRLYGFDNGKKPRIKIVEFQDEENPENLLWLSYQWLEKNSRIQVEYSATVVNVGNLDLGDTVGISNTKLGIKYKTRVFKVERNLINNRLTKFGIGDKVTTSPFSRTIELAKDMKNFQDDTIYWLDKIRERLSDKFLNEDGYNYNLKANNEYNLPAGYYSFDKPINQNPTKVVYMGAGKIAIADSKKPTGEWNWRTFLDGRGASLDLINTGVLKAGRIQSADGSSYWDLDSGVFHVGQQAIEESITATVNAKKDEIVAAIKKDVQIKDGKDGVSSYIHKKYSNFRDGSDMNDDSNSTYLGLYVGESKIAPTDNTKYSWTKIRYDGKLYKGYANSLNGLDFTVVEPDDNSFLLAKNSPHVNISNDEDISDIWQANMFLSLKPNTKYTLTARAKGNNNKLWAYFRNNKTSQEYPWGQLEFGNTLETKNVVFTTGNDVEDVLFKFILVPEDENWTGVQVEWYTIHEGNRNYSTYPTDEPAQYHKYRYFGYVNKDSTPVASDFDWFDIQQKSITGDKYTHIVYSDNPDGSNFGRAPKKYMGVARTNSPATPTDKKTYKWFKLQGEDGARGQDGKSAPNFNLLLNTEIKSNSSYTLNGAAPTIIQNDFNGRNSVEINNNGLTSYGWKGISFISSKKEFKRGDTIVIRLPIYIYSDVPVDNGIHLALKSHVGNKQMAGFNLDSGTPKDIWVIKEFEYTVQQDFTSQSDNLFYIFSTKNGHFKIAEPYMAVDGDMPRDWMPSLEDLKAHSLSANVRVAGTYEGKKTNNIKFYVDVYYDGEKITNGFNLTAKVWGAGLDKTQNNATYNSNGELTNVYYYNGDKDGTTINIKLDVEYNYLKTTCFARLDNLPDPELVKEITNKYRTFDSTLEQFRSQIGEINDKQFKIAVRGDNLLNAAEKKTGNNLTYTTVEPLKPGNTYTLVADFRNFPANQELRVFNSENKRLVYGINIFNFTVPTETRTINLTPLGNTTEVKNLEVWEGNYNEGLEGNSFDVITGGSGNFVALKSKNIFKEGRFYKVLFDTTSPNNRIISIGIDEYVLESSNGKVIPTHAYKPLTSKDNEVIVKISSKSNDDKDIIYLEFQQPIDKSRVTNVRLYEINLGFRYARRNETVDINSLIKQAKNEVSLSVKETLLTKYLTKEQTEATIKVMKDKIENVVTTDNFSTTLTQNAQSLKITWNEMSEYVQFESAGLSFYNGSVNEDNLRARIDGDTYSFWRDGRYLGNMGSNSWADNPDVKGIQFNLVGGNNSAYMGWGYKRGFHSPNFEWKWLYVSDKFGTYNANTLNAHCSVDFHGNYIENAKTTAEELHITDGLTDSIPIVHSISRSNGSVDWIYGYMRFKNGILVDATKPR